jgi:alcohol dehydrogenase
VVIPSFAFASLPHIVFGCGKISVLADAVVKFGKNILILTGGRSFVESDRWNLLTQALANKSIRTLHRSCTGEPSPDRIDQAVAELRDEGVEVVVAIGGGSVIDTGKAISAMLPEGESVFPYLEGVGTGKVHSGRKIPFIAVPTTGGTGSEATKNAVLGHTGPDGFKRSLRHDNFIPNLALIDPELSLTCPSEVTAACGMDALTQLFESFVSTGASPLTDAFAAEGLSCFVDNTLRRCVDTPGDTTSRSKMSLAALLSGITLANAGLGVVHGLASAIGGLFDIPHGVVCGTLLSEATRINIGKIAESKGWDCPELAKHALAAEKLHGGGSVTRIETRCNELVNLFDQWTGELNIPRLGTYGVTEADIVKIVSQTGLKNNPVTLTHEEIGEIVRRRL